MFLGSFDSVRFLHGNARFGEEDPVRVSQHSLLNPSPQHPERYVIELGVLAD